LGDIVKKEEVIEKLGDTWLSTYKLRLAITGRASHNIKVAQEEVLNAAQE
jgi:hypothetical protein